MKRRVSIPMIAVAVMLCCAPAISRASNPSPAGNNGCTTDCTTNCDQGCNTCEVQYVEKTIMVPTWETESRTITVTECRLEPREVTRTVCRRVPVQEERTRTVTICVPEIDTRTITYTECVPVTKQVEKTYYECVATPRQVERTVTVMVPRQVEKTMTRMVCETYQEEVMQTRCRDMGHWENQMVEVPCNTGRGRFRRGSCNSCGTSPCGNSCGTCPPQTMTVCRKVWVPNIVTEQVPCVVTRSRMVPKQFTYTATVCEPQQQTRTCTVMDYERIPHTKMVDVTVYEAVQRTKDVQFTRYVPQQKTETYMVNTCKIEQEEITETIQVSVPYEVEKEIQVRVCKYVPKTVTVAVQPCCGTSARRPLFSRWGRGWGCCQ